MAIHHPVRLRYRDLEIGTEKFFESETELKFQAHIKATLLKFKMPPNHESNLISSTPPETLWEPPEAP